MSDLTNLSATIYAPELPAAHIAAVREILSAYSPLVFTDTLETPDSRFIGVNDANVGSAGELAEDLLRLMRDEDEPHLSPLEFGFDVWEDPGAEWLGRIYKYRPGKPTFRGECDSEGSVLLDAGTLMGLINEASSLDGLKASIRAATGADIT